MAIFTHTPQPPLADFVDLFWYYEGQGPSHDKERVLPTGTMELIVNLREDELRLYDRTDTDRFETFDGCLLAGAQSEYFVIDTEPQDAVMGVHFKPGGGFPFLELPAGELHGEHVNLDTLWGARASELRERLLEAVTPADRFHVLEQLLMTQARSLERHGAVSFALQQFQTPHLQTVSDVTGRIGLSPRRFIDVFRNQVGLTPKLFCRVRRFQEALRLIGQGAHIEWTELALDCGYFDQAHFIRDFRAFSGLRPTDYVRGRGEHVNHVPLPHT